MPAASRGEFQPSGPHGVGVGSGSGSGLAGNQPRLDMLSGQWKSCGCCFSSLPPSPVPESAPPCELNQKPVPQATALKVSQWASFIGRLGLPGGCSTVGVGSWLRALSGTVLWDLLTYPPIPTPQQGQAVTSCILRQLPKIGL